MLYNNRRKKPILFIPSINGVPCSHPEAIDEAKARFAEPAQLVADGRGVVNGVGGTVVVEEVVPFELLEALVAAQVATDCQTLLAHNLIILMGEEISDLLVGRLDDIGQQQRSPRLKHCCHVFEEVLLPFTGEVMDT